MKGQEMEQFPPIHTFELIMQINHKKNTVRRDLLGRNLMPLIPHSACPGKGLLLPARVRSLGTGGSPESFLHLDDAK